ncbi:MAG: Gfo/Idh/MocA family oxidoreductase [bacterium]|nr:Gfo/Idh/MocA family oxidoreductase [bacterium]
MSDRPVGVGFVGLGRWAEVIAQGIEGAAGIETVAGYTRTPEKRVDFAKRYGCDAVDSYEALLAHPGVEAIAILSSTQVHYEQALAAIKAGKHLFLEKPITVTPAEGVEVVRRCDAAGLTLQVGYETRCMAGVRHMKKLIDEGTLGTPVACEANWSHDIGLRLTPDDWHYYWENCPGGPVMQLGIHHANNAILLMGPVARVRAICTQQVTKTEVPDLTNAILEHESGALTYLGNYYHCPRRWHINLLCTGGTASLDMKLTQGDVPAYMKQLLEADIHSTLLVQMKGAEKPEPVALPAGDNIIVAEMAEFARRVRGGGPSDADGPAGVETLSVILAAVESMKSGRAVDMKEYMTAQGAV